MTEKRQRPCVVSHSLFPVLEVSVAVTLQEVGSPSPEQHRHLILTLRTHTPGLSLTRLLWILQHQPLWQQVQCRVDDFIAKRHAICRPPGHEQGSTSLQVKLRQPGERRTFSRDLKKRHTANRC